MEFKLFCYNFLELPLLISIKRYCGFVLIRKVNREKSMKLIIVLFVSLILLFNDNPFELCYLRYVRH